jgi:hypothetical protein
VTIHAGLLRIAGTVCLTSAVSLVKEEITNYDTSVKSSLNPCYWGARAVFGCQYRLMTVPQSDFF